MTKEKEEEEFIKVVCPNCDDWFYEFSDKKDRPKICPFCEKEVFDLILAS